MGLAESGEMYLETIYVLTRHSTSVRSIDVAESMGYSKPSVSRAIGILKAGEYIEVDRSGFITLTEKGVELAKNISKKGMEVQARVNKGITDEELVIFYNTLEKLQNNLKELSEEWEANGISVDDDIIAPISASIPSDQ